MINAALVALLCTRLQARFCRGHYLICSGHYPKDTILRTRVSPRCAACEVTPKSLEHPPRQRATCQKAIKNT